MTDSDRLRREEEVAESVMLCGWAWQETELNNSPSESYAEGVRIIRQERLAVAKVVRRKLLSIIDVCRWTGWDDRKRLQVIEQKIQEADLPALLRRATEAGATENTNKENE